MAFLGADTDELRDVAQDFQEGKETTDQVISFLRALIVILKAASFFSGGASLAYAEYLETTVVPWLERISQALGLFAKVLNSQAEAQDEASNGGTVDFATLPSYQTPALPDPIKPYQGQPIAGPTVTTPTPTGTGAGPTTTTGAPLGNLTGVPSLMVGENGHLLIDTGIDLDGPDVVTPRVDLGTTTVGTPPVSATPAAVAPATPSQNVTPEFGTRSVDPAPAGAPSGVAAPYASPSSPSSPSSPGSPGSPTASPAEGPLGATSIGSPVSHASPATDGFGTSTPTANSNGTPSMGEGARVGTTGDNAPSYGAAAGIAGGAAALGLGGAALASRTGQSGTGGDSTINKLSAANGQGSRGPEVRQLQERLTAAGYDTHGADGAWGPQTQAAYDAYRTDHPLPVAQGTGYTAPSGYDYNEITGVRGNPNVTPDFLRSVEAMSSRLGAQPEHIMAAMSFETGGSFASDVRNPRSSATGLIQFMDATAQGLGTSTQELAQMTPTEQLTYVERYFEPHRGHLGSLESVYTSILAGHPASGDQPLFTQGERAYGPNRELDVNGNGVITAAEATAHVRSRMGGE